MVQNSFGTPTCRLQGPSWSASVELPVALLIPCQSAHSPSMHHPPSQLISSQLTGTNVSNSASFQCSELAHRSKPEFTQRVQENKFDSGLVWASGSQRITEVSIPTEVDQIPRHRIRCSSGTRTAISTAQTIGVDLAAWIPDSACHR